jgi:hypothetical protein
VARPKLGRPKGGSPPDSRGAGDLWNTKAFVVGAARQFDRLGVSEDKETMSGKDSSPTGGATEYAFLASGGEANELMRAFDWRTSPLNSPATWPEAL